MKSKIEYSINQFMDILYLNFSGEITINNFKSSWDEVLNKNLIPQGTKGFVLDYREASFDINLRVNEHHAIAQYYKDHPEVFGKNKIAFITDKPKDVVIPLLLEHIEEAYTFKPFCTLDAATSWVMQ